MLDSGSLYRTYCEERLVHGVDINAAAAFVVDAETQHLYQGYGRGHLPQAERQKLMTGERSEKQKLKSMSCPA